MEGTISNNFRHPLVELKNDCNFVANDTNLDLAGMLVTGPNASGKSIYLSQVALIVYMMHIGCFVPCTRAMISVIASISTCLPTRHSSADTSGLSTFGLDLIQVSAALNSPSRSLILLDEFGQGTVAHDGVGLFVGVVHNILSTNDRLLIASTHYHEIFTNDYFSCTNLQFGTMQVHVTQDFVFLYKLVSGFCSSSLAVECAKRAGFPAKVVNRITAVVDDLRAGKPISRCFNPKRVHQRNIMRDICMAVDDSVDKMDEPDVLGRVLKDLEMFHTEI